MRILMAVAKHPFPVEGGQERQAHELAKVLVQRGHEVGVVSSRFHASQHDVDSIDGARVHRVKWIEFKPARFLLWPFSLARILFRLRREADLVHVHNISWFGAFVTVFAKAFGLPVITKLPNIGEFGVPGMRRRRFGALRIWLLKRSDAIVAMTPESLAELTAIGYPPGRVLKIPNGIALLPEVPRTLSSPSAAVNVAFVGSLVSPKGLLDLIHAWSVVNSRATRPVRMRLIGDGPQAGELRVLVESLRLGGVVEFRGYCADVPAELASADLLALPSYGEGNSNAILEAMRAGMPVVATRLGGAPMQVGSEGERFLVEPGDREALAARLLELVEDDALRLRVGRAMRARSESVFAIDRIAAVYEQAYELVLSGKREQVGRINPGLFG